MKKLLAIILLVVSAGWSTVKYVDLSQVSDSANNDPPHYWHTGSSSDPFNHRNFRDWSCDMNTYGVGKYYDGTWHTEINVKTDTFYIKGTYYAVDGVINNPCIAPDSGQWLLPWNPSVNGPWRIANFAGTATLRGKWSGGYVEKANIAFAAGMFTGYNMYFNATNSFSVVAGLKFYGSTIKTVFIYLNDSTNKFVNSLFIVSASAAESWGTNFRLNMVNSVTNKATTWWDDGAFPPQDSNSQFSWANYHHVAYNAIQDSFGSAINLFNVTSPPQPGKTPYTLHTTDLWGNSRVTIGANYQQSLSVSWRSPCIDTFGKAVSDTMITIAGTVDSVVVYSGTLPSGLTLNKTSGLLSGTPNKVTFKNGITFRAYGGTLTFDFVDTIRVIPCGPKRHYVDLSQATDSATSDTVRYKHTGETDDPFNYRDWREMVGHQPDTTTGRYYDFGWHEAYTDLDTFYLKGIMRADSHPPYNNPTLHRSKIGQVFLPWDAVAYGPYRIYGSGGKLHGTWKGGIIYNPANLFGKFYTMNFPGHMPIGEPLTNSVHFLAGVELYGCTMECNEIWYHDTTGTGLQPPYMQDCMLENPEVSGPQPPAYYNVRAKNCAFYQGHQVMQANGIWVNHDYPADSATCKWLISALNNSNPSWDAHRDSFFIDSVIKNTPTPPRPGIAPYTGYNTDLFGNTRHNIGANYQPAQILVWTGADSGVGGNLNFSNFLNWSLLRVPGVDDSVYFTASGGTSVVNIDQNVAVTYLSKSVNHGTRPLDFNGYKLTLTGKLWLAGTQWTGAVTFGDTSIFYDSLINDTTVPIFATDNAIVQFVGSNMYCDIKTWPWKKASILPGEKLTVVSMPGLGGTSGSLDSLVSGTPGSAATVTKPKDTVAYLYIKDIVSTNGTYLPATSISGGNNRNVKSLSYTGVTKDVSTGPTGTVVTFTGSGFVGACWIKFGTDSSALTVVSYTSATKAVPTLAPGVYAVSVGNSDGDVASVVNFTVESGVTDTPIVSSIAPIWQKRGATFKLRGTKFKSAQGSGTLYLGSSDLLTAATWTDTLIIDTIPASWSPKGTYNVIVKNSDSNRDTTQIRVLIPTITPGTP